MRVVTEKEYCDRCGAEIEEYKFNDKRRYFSLHYITSKIKFLILPVKLFKNKEKIYESVLTEKSYEIICPKCAEEFVEWWNLKGDKK